MPITDAPEIAARAAPFVGTLWSAPLAALAGNPHQIEEADFAAVDAAAPPYAYDRFSRLVDADGHRVSGVILPDLARHARVAAALMRDGACLETQAAITRALNDSIAAFMGDSAAVASALHGPAPARDAFEAAITRYAQSFTRLSAASAFSADATGDALSEWNQMQRWLGAATGHSLVRLQVTLSGERATITALPPAL